MNTFKHLLATALIATSTASFAQTDSTSVSAPTIKSTSYRSYERVRSDLRIYVGLNGLGGTLPAGYEFRPIGSRFIALGWQMRIPVAVGGATKLRLVTGPEVAWNNFMFEGRNMLVKQNNQLTIEQSDVDLHRSKLVTTQLNLPMMLNLSFKSGFSIAAGAYAGLRLDSYTKVKPVGGSSVRTHNSFNLNPVRWGWTAELGYRGHAKLFGRYEPNSPFKAGEGPDASVWTVGLKF
ncbi:outer membrane beta-barrel protein [Spirosoma aerolatum]|uniref:outer membrane beta-barrel protein n=1 Tax=Spirosoma aerolatum TaxID=1211326 RepID=UPI0009ABCD4B|nr:outer membrane beta-barrel protein [Spirosoma aerolatum]